MKPARSRVFGFTLIELVVVVALAAILLTLAAPSFTSHFARKRLEGVTLEFVTDLQYARAEAVQRNGTVSIFTGAACYTVAASAPGGSCTCTSAPGSACTGGPVELKTAQFGNTGVSFTASPVFEFEPIRGMLSAGSADTSATLQSSGGAWQLTAAVLAVGRVSTCSPSGSLKGYPSC